MCVCVCVCVCVSVLARLSDVGLYIYTYIHTTYIHTRLSDVGRQTLALEEGLDGRGSLRRDGVGLSRLFLVLVLLAVFLAFLFLSVLAA